MFRVLNRRNLKSFFCRRFTFPFSFEREKRDFTHLDAHATKRRRKKTCPRPSPRLLRSSFPADRVPVRSTLPLPLLFFVRVTRRRVPKERPTRERMHLFLLSFFPPLSHKFASKKKEVFDGKESGGGTSLKRGARGKRGGHDETRTRANDCFARAREWVRPPIASRGDERKRFPKKCARTSAQCCFLVASRRPLSFSLSFVRGDASLGLGFDADIGDVVSSPSKTNEQAPELPSRPRPPRGQSPASNSTSKPSKTKSLAPSSPKSNARTTRLENRKSPRASKRSEP